MPIFKKHCFNQFDAFQVYRHPLRISGATDEEFFGGASNHG